MEALPFQKNNVDGDNMSPMIPQLLNAKLRFQKAYTNHGGGVINGVSVLCKPYHSLFF